MSKICLVGGGRWAKVLLQVIRDLEFKNLEIFWVTHSNFENSGHWLTSMGMSNITLLPEICLQKTEFDAVIVANSPHNHYKVVKEAITSGNPVLCEKPLVLDFEQARELSDLAKRNNVIFGVNLEFLFASYLHDFAQSISTISVNSISVLWQDPWVDKRHGEIKYGDLYTDIIHDMFPHCWSLLRVLMPGRPVDKIQSVCYRENADVEVIGNCGSVGFDLRLSRRASQRTRKIIVNDGEAELDFSEEPGFITIAGSRLNNNWKRRPLGLSLESFFDAIESKNDQTDWPLSIEDNLPAVELACQASLLLRDSQKDRLQNLLRDSKNLVDEPELLALIVDMFVPLQAQLGERVSAHSAIEQLSFGQLWLKKITDGELKL